VIGVPLRVGSVRLTSNLLLAPIAGWCDLAWRVTCRDLASTNGGLGLACTDLLSPKGLLIGSEASTDLARTNDLDRPVGMQLYGADPRLLGEAARWCADHGATVVDLNMGCPVDKVCKRNGGSKLMCDPELAVRIAESCRAALPDHVPLTAKMRLGWTEHDARRNAAGELAVRLVAVGVAAVTVHGRTTDQRFRGNSNPEGIRRVVETVAERCGLYQPESDTPGVPVIANGDVRTPHDVVELLRRTGAAGVMIGRGAFAMPWIFRAAWDLEQRVRSGLSSEALDAIHTTEPSEREKLDAMQGYFERMREYRDDRYALHKIRQKISWLGKTINDSHCKPLKDEIRASQSPADVHAAIARWRHRLEEPTVPAGAAEPVVSKAG